MSTILSLFLARYEVFINKYIRMKYIFSKSDNEIKKDEYLSKVEELQTNPFFSRDLNSNDTS
ncbi:MAG: hypothetical protein MHPSP_004547, partial [Paramarteilia canceri]